MKSIGIVPSFESAYAVVFLLSAGMGIALYLAGLSLFLKILKKIGKKISHKTEYKINKIMGVLLIVLSFYFLFKSAEVCFKFFM